MPTMEVNSSENIGDVAAAEESRKEQAAAEIMATLKPAAAASSSVPVEVDAGAAAVASVAAVVAVHDNAVHDNNNESQSQPQSQSQSQPQPSRDDGGKPVRKKRKRQQQRRQRASAGGGGSGSIGDDDGAPPSSSSSSAAASSSSPSSSSSPFGDVDDVEFVRSIAAEFRRRGYSAAMLLRPLSAETTNNAKANNSNATSSASASATASAEGSSSSPPSSSSATPTTPKSPRYPDLPDFPFYPSSTGISKNNAARWDAAFDRLVAYRAANGGALPLARNDPTVDPALGKWTRTQLSLWRRARRDGKHNLNLDRIAKLHSLDLGRQGAMEARSLEGEDAEARAMMMAAKGRDGDAEGAGGEEEGQDVLLEKQMMLVASMGKNRQKWQDKFEDLRRYKEEHGDTNVPRSYDNALSKWCNTQRRRCKQFMDGNAEQVHMTRMQFRALESIGFNMTRARKIYDRSVLTKRWEDKYQELLDYKEKYGNCDVAVRKGFESYKQLANWAGLQRRKYKAKMTGTKAGRTTGITDEEIKKLASVGFSFSLQDDFDTRFKHLCEFKKEFGHTKVPVFYTGYNNLGRWAKRMRDGIRNEEEWMDDVRKTRLLGIDFDIAARHVFGHKPKKRPEEEEEEDEEEQMEAEDDDDDGLENGGGLEADGRGVQVGAGPPMPAQARAAEVATTLLTRMDDVDFTVRPTLPPFGNGIGGPPQFFYHGYPPG